MPSTTTQIFIGLLAGIVIGYLWPSSDVNGVHVAGAAEAIKPLADTFLRMIKMIIAPLLFATLVVGIAGTGDLKAMGRIGLKAIIYFEIATTIALFLGLGLVNVFEPGRGLQVTVSQGIGEIAGRKPLSGWELLMHLFPTSVVRRDGGRRHPAARRLLDLLRDRAWPRSARRGSRSSTCSRAPRR